MASRLAQQAAAHGLGPKSKASKLYQEVGAAQSTRLALLCFLGFTIANIVTTQLHHLGKGLSCCFGVQVCRCLPFIARLHKLEEVSNLRELRAIVKSRFHEFKDVKDPRVCQHCRWT
jgi:hypothetical protein